IHRKYDNNDKVTLACSMPSIEYWLLLHFENTNRYFGSSAKVIEALRKYIIGFDKNERFLKQEK
ncbi:MAG: RloB family protein, partial [Muribaculaceae bacterium]|nr:RloB family protein [Muribaculaceae bacterium]